MAWQPPDGSPLCLGQARLFLEVELADGTQHHLVHMALFNHVDGIRWQIWDKYMLVSIRLCISMFPWMEFEGGQIEPILPHIVK